MRFTATMAAAQTQITFQNLLDTWLLAASAVTAYDVFHTVRLRAVEVWGIAVAGTPTTVEVNFTAGASGSGQIGSGKIVSDTSMGVQPAHIRATPGPQSMQSLWQVSGSQLAFVITCPAGSVIDLEMSFKADPTVVKASQNAPAAATTGTIVNRGFDGAAIAATNFPPVVEGAI